MRVEDSALTPDVRAAQVRKGTRLPSETTKLSVSRSARFAVTRFVPSYPALPYNIYLQEKCVNESFMHAYRDQREMTHRSVIIWDTEMCEHVVYS